MRNVRTVASGVLAASGKGDAVTGVRSFARAVLTVGLLAAIATASFGQDRFGGRAALRREASSGAFHQIGLEVGPRVFGASPVGVGFDLGGFGADADYSDLFSDGVGVGVIAYMPFHLAEPGVRAIEVAIGPLLAIDRVTYGGADFTDSFGTRIEPDDMHITRILAGFHVRLRVGGAEAPVRFLFGAQIALGAALIEQVDADLFAPGPLPGTLYDDTSTVAFELLVRPGISFQVAPQVSVAVMLTLGFDVIGAPRDADSPSNPIAPADASAILDGIYGLAVTVTIRFPA